jgi:two-component system sensor histidine kinase KdpD
MMYFVIALISGVLTFKIRQIEKVVKEKDEKAKSIKFYNTLLNSLSHELRTPITTIVGSTDNLLMNSENLSETDKAELLSEIYIATDRLNQQIENLLNMSRLESGFLKPKKDWCDIDELIHKTLNRLDSSLRKYTVSVRIPEPFPLFRLDFGLMEQVMYNLILNVTQHTPPGTSISIEATSLMDELELSISDNGTGFPKEELSKVFEKFHRVHGSKTGGTGLGLSIVKGFVEAHGGMVQVQNLPEPGSKFTIKIPADRSTINKLNNE